MRVEKLVYGDDPTSEYPEDFNSFKIFTVWSEPDIVSEPDDGPVETRDQDTESQEKRLVTAVEFPVTVGSYFFVERPEAGPDWLCKAFKLLKDEGWQGHSFKDFRVECRGEIEIEDGESWTAVIDRKTGKVFHNRDKRQGAGEMEELESFRSN